MAKCKVCKTDIPNDAEYCEDCLEKGHEKSNELYLDSLLNSVKNTEHNAEMIYKRKLGDNKEDRKTDKKSPDEDVNDDVMKTIDKLNEEDFDQFSFDEDLGAFKVEDIINYSDYFDEDIPDYFSGELNSKERSPQHDFSKNNKGQDELEDYSNLRDRTNQDNYVNQGRQDNHFNQDNYVNQGHLDNQDNQDNYINQGNQDERVNQDNYINQGNQDNYVNQEEQDDYVNQSNHFNQENPGDVENKGYLRNEDKDLMMAKTPSSSQSQKPKQSQWEDEYSEVLSSQSTVQDEPEHLFDNVNEEEIQNFNSNEGSNNDLSELLNGLDSYQAKPVEDVSKDSTQVPTNNSGGMISEGNKETKDSQTEAVEEFYHTEDEDDFLSLLNQISADDPVAKDVMAIGDMMSGEPQSQSKTDPITDVGAVFSDALKVVSSLNDPNLNEEELLGNIEGKKGKKDKKKKEKKEKKEKKNSKKGKDKLELNEEQELEEDSAKPKKSLFQRLFGNIKDETDLENNDEEKELPLEDFSIQSIDQDKPPKEKKSKKRSKGKDAKKQKLEETDDEEETTTKKEKQKKEKEKKPKKKKELMQVIDEIDEDVGRINRLGASIVFLFFGLLALLLYVGSNAVNYTISMKHASNYFDKQKYTQAYYEVYGVKIKDEDLQLYNKIETVMFVNKELNSYNNYCSMEKYPQALDSLLKGLKRYNKYIELADLLGIKTDMDYVRKQILAELNKAFKVSEKEAMKMIKIEDMKEYSLRVYDIVVENKDKLQSKGMKKNDSYN